MAALKLEQFKKKFENFNCTQSNAAVNLASLEHFSICNGAHFGDDFLKCAVLIILFRTNDEFHFIFTVRSSKLKSFPGEICFPGGKFDTRLDKSFTDTALREANEEIGLKRENFLQICQMCPFISPVGHW